MAKRPEHARMKIDIKQILKKKTTEMVRELVADSPTNPRHPPQKSMIEGGRESV